MSKKLEVSWKPGSKYTVNPEQAYDAVEKIRQKNNGDVLPEHVVAAAKSKRHVLHSEFEWDDTVAATEHRMEQARKLLRSLVVVRDEIVSERPQRAYEVVRNKPTTEDRPRNVYRKMEDIMADPDTRAELLGRALKELVRIRNQFRDLQELAVVMRAIDETLETVEVA